MERRFNFSGKLFNVISYGVDRETERIDYAELERLARQHRPKMIVAGFSAYPGLSISSVFRQIADKVGAMLMADIAHIAGMVAVGLHPTPVPYCEVVTSTTHKTLRGPRGGFILCRKELGAAIDKAVFPQMQGGPLMHVIAAKAVSFREALQPGFAEYQRAILDNAHLLATELKRMGMRPGSGGTDTPPVVDRPHQIRVQRAKRPRRRWEEPAIVANHNLIPFRPAPSNFDQRDTAGNAGVTTRGFGPEEMKIRGRFGGEGALATSTTNSFMSRSPEEVKELCSRFPVPGLEC